MKNILSLSLVLIFLCPSPGLAGPLITRVDPPEVVVIPRQEMKVVHVTGHEIWASGPGGAEEFARRTQAYIRREGAFEQVHIYGYGYWSDQQRLTLNIPAHPWFASAGTFEVMVKVDRQQSNYYQVPVLAGPPVIQELHPATITLSQTSPRHESHEIRIAASNLGNVLKTSILLDGKRLQSYRLGPGALIAFIPETVFNKPGSFDLQVESSAGLSNKKSLILVGPAPEVDSQSRAKQAQTQKDTLSKTPLPPAAPSTAGREKGSVAKTVSAPALPATLIVQGEALSADAKSTQSPPTIQQMSSFGTPWSGNAQLYWVPQSSGASLSMNVSVPNAGRYKTDGYFTKAPDYGTFQLYVNGRKVGKAFDGYNPGVVLSGPVDLDTISLKQGNNDFKIKIEGRNSKSSGYMVGVDRFELTAEEMLKTQLKPVEAEIMPLER